MNTIRELADYADVFTEQAKVVAFSADNPVLDLIPLPGGKYAIPVERWEAARRLVRCALQPYCNMGNEEQRKRWLEGTDKFICEVLTAALGGEVYPVEAVVTLPDPVTVGDRILAEADDVLQPIRGRTAALIADGQEGDA